MADGGLLEIKGVRGVKEVKDNSFAKRFTSSYSLSPTNSKGIVLNSFNTPDSFNFR